MSESNKYTCPLLLMAVLSATFLIFFASTCVQEQIRERTTVYHIGLTHGAQNVTQPRPQAPLNDQTSVKQLTHGFSIQPIIKFFAIGLVSILLIITTMITLFNAAQIVHKPYVSVIVPTYNEKKNLPILVQRIHTIMNVLGKSYEVIVVDDDSADKTWMVAKKLSVNYPVRVIRRRGERGLASAVVRGFKEARGNFICVLDADLQHPPEKIPELLFHVENGIDIAIASRWIGAGNIGDWNLRRKLTSKGAELLAKILIPEIQKISDPLSGFFMLKRSVIANSKLQPIGYKILLEILVRGKWQKVAEVPYTFGSRVNGRSNLDLSQYIAYLKHLSQLSRAERAG